MTQTDWLQTLNPAQHDAVTHGDGPLLVVAGAGTGKTWTLACRVAHLIRRGVRPERILLLTFTRRAAREMLGRAGRLTGREVGGRVWGGTFHAVANRLLRLHGRSLGLPPDFTVMDQSDTADLMNLIRGELGLDTLERRFPRKETLAAIHSRTVNAGSKLLDVLKRDFPWCAEEAEGIRAIFVRYAQRKRDQHVLDYDDLLLYWKALVADPASAPPVLRRFDHVLVDEYQDTNALQADVLEGLYAGTRNVVVVGDDAQAIYSFRAATVRNILEFPDRFAGARVVRLEQNYRSTGPILAASNALIARSASRHEKTLWTERAGGARPVLMTCLDEAEQSDEVCRLLLEHRERGTPLRHQVVLFRTGHHSDLLEVELARRNIPFVKYGGLKFMEAAHVKDALSLLRILENPRDEVSWFRVLQLLEGVGPGRARVLLEELGLRSTGTPTPDPLTRFVTKPQDLTIPPDAARDFQELRGALADCRPGGSGDEGLAPSPQIDRLRRFLDPVVERRYESATARIRDLEQLAHLASGYSDRGRFLAELTLDPPASTGDLAGPPLLDEDYVILSTIHSAKGGEWDVVHVIHAADGMIPSDMATGDAETIEEERRLLYVALTRARDSLYVYFPLRYYRRPRGLDDAHSYAQLSRFLDGEVRQLFEERTVPADAGQRETGSGKRTARAGTPALVDSYLAGLFGD
ncbi:MAG: ATP-dependent helicase [Actinomycetota bacterium]|nr:ATP-dependent helicase [Actinomycetota bacterium]